MTRSDKRFPFAAEFSPGVLKPPDEALEIFQSNSGDYHALLEAIRSRYFAEAALRRSAPGERFKQQQTRAMNVLLGARAYGLFDASWNITPLLEDLLKANSGERWLTFARHILRNLNGLDLLRAISLVQQRGERPTKETIGAELERSGYWRTVNSTYEGRMRQWLELSGVIDKNYVINNAKVASLIGVDTERAEGIANLTIQQRAFLTAAARLGAGDWVAAKEVRRYAAEVLKVQITPGRQADAVTTPLEIKGLIERDVQSGGRGGKSGNIRVSQGLAEADLEHLISQNAFRINDRLKKAVLRPLSFILNELDSNSTDVRGLALEALTIRIAQFLGLVPRQWREQSGKTGGTEVDLIAESGTLVASRWQVQCKNSAEVNVDDIAKEHGIAQLIHSNVILMITTGRFSAPVRTYANAVMAKSNLAIILLDGMVFIKIRNSGSFFGVIDACNLQAERALKLKDVQLDPVR